MQIMQSPCLKEAKVLCLHGCCCLNPILGVLDSNDTVPNTRTTSATCRHSFTATTTTSFFPNTYFTNHESLPSLEETFIQFIKAYPQYSKTIRIDQIRAQEYYHLCFSSHVCLDYIGVGLFSYSQVDSQSSSASLVSSRVPGFPFFSIIYKSVEFKSELIRGGKGSEMEFSMKKKIMDFLNISQDDYSMVFTANRSSAFKLVAESYPFQKSRKLLSVYDCENEAMETMLNSSEKRGAQVMSAEFKWPRLRIQAPKLRKMLVRKKKEKKNRGLFVFPLQSRMTGANYSYQWMSLAQENGWHVLLDACALGPKDMDSFGLSLIRPDFLVCSFYKIFGENPTGFGCLFVKKSIVAILETSAGGGIVSIVPSGKGEKEDELDTSSSFSDPIIVQQSQTGKSGNHESSMTQETQVTLRGRNQESSEKIDNEGLEIECRCLDHIDSLGLRLISSRGRYLINWLVTALMKFQHPNRLDNASLVKIYGPKIKFDRGPAIAFNIYDWKGEKVEPVLVQKLADRNSIALGHGFLHNIWFSDKYQEDKESVLERRKGKQGISVVTLALSFLANFEDVYRLWIFVARFLDADYVEKEKWRYIALNQKTVELLE